jgi:hypothetical protein
MRLNAYGKLLEIIRENESWVIYEVGEGKKSRSNDIYIPSDYNKEQVVRFLEDMLHERATPDDPNIKIIK